MSGITDWIGTKTYILVVIVTLIYSYVGIGISYAEIGDVLIDGEIKEISPGDSWKIKEGYVLTITLENDWVIFSVSKDGREVKKEKLKTGDSFYYFKRLDTDNYKIISVPSFSIKNNKIWLRLYQYSEGILSENNQIVIQTIHTPGVADTKLLNNDVLNVAKKYTILLDVDSSLLQSINLNGNTFYIISYSNLLPYAEGIEVLSSAGKRITSQSEVEPVFTSFAWKEASSQLMPADIQTMRDILQTSKDIDSSVSPVVQVTGHTVSSINSLKGKCISVVFDKVCAWDIVAASFPGINSVANQLDSFNEELNQWKSATSSVQQHLPNAINGIEQAKSGGDINPSLQNEISQSLSAFGTLQSRTNQMSSRLSSMSSTLSSAENGVRSSASNPVVGSIIRPVAEAIGSMRGQVDTLKGKADSFSGSMGQQSAKLSAVTTAANSRTSELRGIWNARQSAETKVYATIGGIGILILIIVAMILMKKKRGQEI